MEQKFYKIPFFYEGIFFALKIKFIHMKNLKFISNLVSNKLKKFIHKLKVVLGFVIDDHKLKYYKWEMENDSNDGWTRKHFKKMYENRKKELKIK